tara:strand:+ start:19487 stop:20272 length:786 start_codon:yes stop_codon:yes gene_type:complete
MTDIINLSTFNEVYLQLDENPDIDNRILDKINNIKDIINKDVYIKPSTKTFVKHISAFNCRFREEDTKKKTIISFLNKLTNTNIDIILAKLENNISEPYDNDIRNVINFMRLDIKNIKNYIRVLKIFNDNEVISQLDIIYNKNPQYWITPDEYVKNNVYSTYCPEDIYSSFNKWKDSQLVLTELLLFYKDIHFVSNIAKDILNFVLKNYSTRELIDPTLEHLIILYQLVNNKDLYKLTCIDTISSCTKFKIEEIKNKIENK